LSGFSFQVTVVPCGQAGPEWAMEEILKAEVVAAAQRERRAVRRRVILEGEESG
jgi:hypothetical protein